MSTQSPYVLLVDDEEDLCLLMKMTLKRMGILCDTAYNVQQAKKYLLEKHYDACITDLNLPDTDGIALVKYVTENYPKTPIAVLTAYGNMEIAIAALKAGAFDFVSKPVNTEALKNLLDKALVSLDTTTSEEKRIDHQMLIGQSPPIEQLRSTLHKVARTQAPVFITGESGTGKEVVAKLIHEMSNRKEGAFIAINCGAIPVELMESELFGHKKGSFTGANQDKLGLIQAADGGSLFLDEIAELPMNMQVKLLRAVQEKKVRPIGTDNEIPVDFRIISATHQDLEYLIQEGKFRQDLFFRLHVMDIRLPPLRERGQDILILAEHFIAKVCQDWGIANKKLTATAKDWLMEQSYLGNVRELRNIIERAITLSESEVIDATNLTSMMPNKSLNTPSTDPAPTVTQSAAPSAFVTSELPQEGLEAYLESIEKKILLDALEKTHWNRTLAAKKLQMSFRSLRYRLKKFGLDTDKDDPSD